MNMQTINKFLGIFGYQINRRQTYHEIFYKENEEVGAKNLSEKLSRLAQGGEFEWPNMVALNKLVASFIYTEKKIINIGAGTGTFEQYASQIGGVEIIASEFDVECVNWCKENRAIENVTYCSLGMDSLLQIHGKFDLAVSIDVIEHIDDYGKFLRQFSALSDNAILTTPNKSRSKETHYAASPPYEQHVREWTSGEFYWILRMFYSEVKLFGMPDVYCPEAVEIGILSNLTPIIAVCKK